MTEPDSQDHDKPLADVSRVIHVIHATWDYHACRRRYIELFGAVVFAEGYTPGADRDMNLFYVADTMLEIMAPRDKRVTFRNFVEKYGEGWHSFELQIADPMAVYAGLRERGIRYVEPVEGSRASWTHPKDSFGMLIELVDAQMPNDPFDYTGWNPKWSAGNPMSLDSLAAIVVAVPDLSGARDFLVDCWGATVCWSDAVRTPEALDRCLVTIAGTPFLLVMPTSTTGGPVHDYMTDRSPGIYSLAWNVLDLEQARRRFADLDVRLEEGSSAMGAFSIMPSEIFGARHEIRQLP